MDSIFADLDHSEIAQSLSEKLYVLPEEKSHAVFAISSFLETTGKWNGIAFHQIQREWLTSGLNGMSALKEWLRSKLEISCRSDRSFDRALKDADRICGEEKIWAAMLKRRLPPSDAHADCPQLLFGRGDVVLGRPLAAVFNSRKPRIISPDEDWLRIMRAFLQRAASDLGIVSSLGAATYDLVTACASQLDMAMLLTAPFPVEGVKASSIDILSPRSVVSPMIVSCLTRAAHCSKATRMICRDRIVAFLSDLHLLLEIRSKGNLEAILERQQEHDPRPQRVFLPDAKDAQSGGNLHLLESFPRWAKPFRVRDHGAAAESSRKRAALSESLQIVRKIAWSDYLYHYTRACPGPWPGQAYRERLLSLFAGDALAGHAALDTLIRIIIENRVRASSRIVRGGEAVVCWSARHPGEIDAIRRWNPALIRWTFEPYGIAVKRSCLRRLGAKPTIYGKSEAYARIRPSERHRFQKHEPPVCAWKHEREWRLPRDLLLCEIPSDAWFVFAPTGTEAEKLSLYLNACVRVAILSQISFEP